MNRLVKVFAGTPTDTVPSAVLVDDLLIGLSLSGAGPHGREGDDSIDLQLERLFASLEATVAAAGASVDSIAHVTFSFAELSERSAINPPWVAMFPNAEDRPTYKFMPAELPPGRLVQAEFYAVPGERRTDLSLEGVAHTNPIPLAVQIGRYLFTSRLLAYDPATGSPPPEVNEQAELLFDHASALLHAAGMGWDDVRNGLGFCSSPENFGLLQLRWDQHVPTVNDAPLHQLVYGGGALKVMLELIARRP